MLTLDHCDLQRQMGVNNLHEVVTRQRGGRESNSQPLSCESNTLTTRLMEQLLFYVHEVVTMRSTCPLDSSGSPTSAIMRKISAVTATSTPANKNSEDAGTISASATIETPAAVENSGDAGTTSASATVETPAVSAISTAATDNSNDGRLALVRSHQRCVASKLAVIQQLSPVPRSKAVRQRKQKMESAEIVISSPYKQKVISKKNDTLQKASKGGARRKETGGKQCKKKKKMTCRAD